LVTVLLFRPFLTNFAYSLLTAPGSIDCSPPLSLLYLLPGLFLGLAAISRSRSGFYFFLFSWIVGLYFKYDLYPLRICFTWLFLFPLRPG
jgi:hypothetical protein